MPVTVSATNSVAKYAPFTSNYDVVGFVNAVFRRDSNDTYMPLGATNIVTATYSIGATICNPRSSTGSNKTLLLATPGLGFDRRYSHRSQ